MEPGCPRRSISAGSRANQPEVTNNEISAPISGVHHHRAPKTTIAATPIKSTGPGGNLGYAGSPESHCVHRAIATATSPPAVSLVSSVRFVFISFLTYFSYRIGDSLM